MQDTETKMRHKNDTCPVSILKYFVLLQWRSQEFARGERDVISNNPFQ